MSSFKPILLTTAAVCLLAACSSKNPDTLIGTNLDENAAMMDANAAVAANLAATNGASSNAPPSNAAGANPPATNASSEAKTNEPAQVSANVSVAKPSQFASPQRSAEVNAARNSPSTSTRLNDIDNQVTTEPDVPNVTTNDLD